LVLEMFGAVFRTFSDQSITVAASQHHKRTLGVASRPEAPTCTARSDQLRSLCKRLHGRLTGSVSAATRRRCQQIRVDVGVGRLNAPPDLLSRHGNSQFWLGQAV